MQGLTISAPETLLVGITSEASKEAASIVVEGVMMKTYLRVLMLSSAIALPSLAMSQVPNGGQPGSGVNPGGNGGFVSETFTTESTQQFMGMSQRTPPNANAAASQGTRTETTTTTIVVNGPKGQVDNYDPADSSSSCNNCTITVGESTTVVTDLPGKKR